MAIRRPLVIVGNRIQELPAGDDTPKGDADTLDGFDSTYFSPTTHNHTLDSLSNVTITANVNGHILRWDGTKWVNNSLAAAGISAVGHTHDATEIVSGTLPAARLSGTYNITNSGSAATWTTSRTITLTGDVTGTSAAFNGSGNISFAATVGNGVVTNAKLANMAQNTVKGRISSGTGVPEDLTPAQIITMLLPADGAGSLLDADLLDGIDSAAFLQRSGGTMTGFLTLNADPTSNLHSATKQYVDTVAQGLIAKQAVRVATTANITLSGEQTIDGVLTSANRVLVKNQTNQTQNGIYLSSSGAWTRTTDADTYAELPSAFVFVQNGTTQADTGWVCNSPSTGTLGSTNITWVQFSGAGSYTADGNGIELVGTQFQLELDGTTLVKGGAGLKVNAGAGNGLDADLLDGQHGSFYQSASNLNAGTVPSARLSGTYTITNAGSAATWTTGRTITLTGDVTGTSAAFNGSANLSFAVTVANTAITNAKLANVNTATFKGRTTAGSGSPEDLTVAQAKTLLDLTGTNSGDQTITLTGDVTGSGTGSFAATIANSAVTNAKMANMLQNTIKGRITASTGAPEDLTPANVITMLLPADGAGSLLDADLLDGQQGAFYQDASNLNAGTLPSARLSGTYTITNAGSAATWTTGRTIQLTGDVTGTSAAFNGSANLSFAATVANNAISNAKMATMTQATIKGRASGAGTGDPTDLTAAQVKTILDLTGTNSGDQTITLTGDVTGSGTGSFAATIANSAVTNAKMANMTASTFKGRVTASTGAPEDMSVAQVNSLLNSTIAPVFTNITSRPTTLAGYGITDAVGTFTATTGVSAAGTNQGTATAITATSDHQLIEVTTVAANTGVRFPTAAVKQRFLIANRGANNLNVYPATSGTIDGQAVNLPVVVGVGQMVLFAAKDTVAWFSHRDSTFNATNPAALGTASPGTSLDSARADHVHPAVDLGTGAASGTLAAARFPALTGNVTTTAGSLTTTIGAGVVTNAMLANMAQSTVLGRASGAGTGAPVDLTAAQLITILLAADGAGSLLDADFLDGINSTQFVRSDAATTMTAALTLSGDPTANLHAAPRQYVDALNAKRSCRVATTANITLSGEQTIDGVLTSGSRVLVKNQTTTSQNGIYVSAAGAWTRGSGTDSWDELVSAFTFVEQGTTQADTCWLCTSDRGGTLGSTAVTWAQFGAGGDAATLNGQAGSFYQNAGNLNAGTLPSARLSGSYTITNTGSAATWTTGRTITLTGNVTGVSAAFNGSANLSFATTIANGVVTNAMLANMAQATVIGRAAGAGTGAPVDLTATQLVAVLDTVTPYLPTGGGTLTGTLTAPAYRDTASTVATTTGTVDLSASTAGTHVRTLTGNTTFTFSGATSGVTCTLTVVLIQDATGSRTVAWPASVRWSGGAPTISTAANSRDMYTFMTTDGGTIWYGNTVGKGYA